MKTIPSFPNYSATADGRIFNSLFYRELKATLSRGYPLVSVCKNSKAYSRSVHSLVAEAFIGPRPHGKHVNHKNGIKLDNRASNLEYVTPKQNSMHAHRMGLVDVARGGKHYLAKLTEPDVHRIRSEEFKELSQRKIAKLFGVSQMVISRVIRRISWKHI